MTKRGGILLAVAALVALTGCSASPTEPLTAESSAPVSASASPSASAAAKVAKKPVVNPDVQMEKQFTEFALLRAEVHSVSDTPSEKQIVSALRSFCENGKPFKISKSVVYNENLDMAADKAYCDHLAK